MQLMFAHKLFLQNCIHVSKIIHLENCFRAKQAETKDVLIKVYNWNICQIHQRAVDGKRKRVFFKSCKKAVLYFFLTVKLHKILLVHLLRLSEAKVGAKNMLLKKSATERLIKSLWWGK